MKRKIITIISLVLSTVLLASCGGEKPKEETTGKVLRVSGSTSMEKVIKALNGAFEAENSGVTVQLNLPGSGSGIKEVGEGKVDIGLSSRDLKAEETGFEVIKVAIDGIGVIVNKDVGVTDISLENLQKVYTREITNWNEIGGADLVITLIGREDGSGTRDGFESIVMGGNDAQYAQTPDSTGAVISGVSGTVGAIGYASLANIDDSVITLKVDGIAPTDEAIQNGSYAVQRDFNCVVKEGENAQLAKSYLEFALSQEGQELVKNAGAIKAK